MNGFAKCFIPLMFATALIHPTAGFTATEATPYAACILKARQVITQTSAYRNASVREKQVLLNSYNAEVTRQSAQCAPLKGN
jgi:hypothetical protein